ncbi:AraC family transcriptional regulator [Achromobacter insolitus]|uniref:AraC family transcriptional regulator n=1 Tax=Achromobacter insolitus TaxID=217204 RepID=UPI0007C80054|nr:AraC family transcriptional regulator [Achromobacter insolitus]GLK98023.1 AraC family transcriptional regulator [Achromobacter xylosoxidans]APX73872.1 transcriptional regulator [Achromobacter insolitus]OAE61020.1 transcriptional regulator [Achromobacter insolitus]OCZ58315.1 transcriptional regulator [Achromobacter insolitus]OWT53869.1 AraC family transcriptional regulator [Achromobacter insolitus]
MLDMTQSALSTSWPPAGPRVESVLGQPAQQLFASGDLDEARSMVGRVMRPHHLGVVGAVQRLDARMHHQPLGEVSLNRLRYGANVEIRPGPLEDFFLVQMPLSGCARISSGPQQLDSTPEVASVVSPDDDLAMRWADDNDQFMLRVGRSLLERTLVGHLGCALDRPLRFQLGFRWRECPAWRCLMSYLLDCSTQHANLAEHKLIVHQMEQLVAATLLSAQPHNYTGALPGRRGAVLPRHVRSVQDYLQAHAHEPVSAEQLARIAGVSVRSLYAGFKEFLGVSPMHYLRDLRMERAHAELVSGESRNIAGVALRWGFAHMGRFSAGYKERYGVSPSESLRRRG